MELKDPGLEDHAERPADPGRANGHASPHVVRMVFDLKGLVKPQVFYAHADWQLQVPASCSTCIRPSHLTC